MLKKIKLSATNSSYIDNSNQMNNFENSHHLLTGTSSQQSSSSNIYTSILKFKLPYLKPYDIQNVYLNIYVEDVICMGSSIPVNICGTFENINFNTLSWNSCPKENLTTPLNINIKKTSKNKFIRINITSIFKHLSRYDINYNFMILPSKSTHDGIVSFSSVHSDNKPYLIIESLEDDKYMYSPNEPVTKTSESVFKQKNLLEELANLSEEINNDTLNSINKKQRTSSINRKFLNYLYMLNNTLSKILFCLDNQDMKFKSLDNTFSEIKDVLKEQNFVFNNFVDDFSRLNSNVDNLSSFINKINIGSASNHVHSSNNFNNPHPINQIIEKNKLEDEITANDSESDFKSDIESNESDKYNDNIDTNVDNLNSTENTDNEIDETTSNSDYNEKPTVHHISTSEHKAYIKKFLDSINQKNSSYNDSVDDSSNSNDDENIEIDEKNNVDEEATVNQESVVKQESEIDENSDLAEESTDNLENSSISKNDEKSNSETENIEVSTIQENSDNIVNLNEIDKNIVSDDIKINDDKKLIKSDEEIPIFAPETNTISNTNIDEEIKNNENNLEETNDTQIVDENNSKITNSALENANDDEIKNSDDKTNTDDN